MLSLNGIIYKMHGKLNSAYASYMRFVRYRDTDALYSHKSTFSIQNDNFVIGDVPQISNFLA